MIVAAASSLLLPLYQKQERNSLDDDEDIHHTCSGIYRLLSGFIRTTEMVVVCTLLQLR